MTEREVKCFHGSERGKRAPVCVCRWPVFYVCLSRPWGTLLKISVLTRTIKGSLTCPYSETLSKSLESNIWGYTHLLGAAGSSWFHLEYNEGVLLRSCVLSGIHPGDSTVHLYSKCFISNPYRRFYWEPLYIPRLLSKTQPEPLFSPVFYLKPTRGSSKILFTFQGFYLEPNYEVLQRTLLYSKSFI